MAPGSRSRGGARGVGERESGCGRGAAPYREEEGRGRRGRGKWKGEGIIRISDLSFVCQFIYFFFFSLFSFTILQKKKNR